MGLIETRDRDLLYNAVEIPGAVVINYDFKMGMGYMYTKLLLRRLDLRSTDLDMDMT